MGLDNVSVLDGGFAFWKSSGYDIESGEPEACQVRGTFFYKILDGVEYMSRLLLKTGKLNLKLTPRFDYIDAMTAVAKSGSKQVVDTRAADNFYGRKEEPSQCKQNKKN